MSGLINSFLIEPVVRHARRFSGSPTPSSSSSQQKQQQSRPHVSHSNSSPRSSLLRSSSSSDDVATDEALSQQLASLRSERKTATGSVEDSCELGHPEQAIDEDAAVEDPYPLTNNAGSSSRNISGLAGAPDHGIVGTPIQTEVDLDVDAEDSNEIPGAAMDSFRALSLDEVPPTSRNPSLDTVSSLDSRQTPLGRTDSQRSGLSFDTERAGHAVGEESRAADSTVSRELPADDGMSRLREKLHSIRDMATSTEDKAKRMHALMARDYRRLAGKAIADGSKSQIDSHADVQTSASRPTTNDVLEESAKTHSDTQPALSTSGGDSTSHFDLSLEDLQTTYQPRAPSEQPQDGPDIPDTSMMEDSHDNEDLLELGCIHYKRNVKIQCADCQRWYTCRLCHDEAEMHTLDRKKTKNMLCMLCKQPQPAAEYCHSCGELTANYYCDICKLWDNDTTRKIYHCHDCGICRRGEGLGKDYVHCKKCNVCISIAWAPTHRCVERATECDCPICGEWMFTSSESVVAMKCGHYIHRSCYDAYMKVSYKCPICNRSAVNMELQWRKLDRHIEAQPMPPQWQDTMVWATCNDCAARIYTTYHWLGNKCTVCDSYNTNEVKVVNAPANDQDSGGPTVDDEPMQRPEDSRVLEDVIPTSEEVSLPIYRSLRDSVDPNLATGATSRLVTTPNAPPTPPLFEDTDGIEVVSSSSSAGQDIPANRRTRELPTYSNQTATPHSPPQPSYLDAPQLATSPESHTAFSGVTGVRDGVFVQPQPKVTFAASAMANATRMNPNAETFDPVSNDGPYNATLSGIDPCPHSPPPALFPLPSSPPFTGRSPSPPTYSSEDQEDDADYDSEEEITFWGSLAISPSSWGVSIPSVNMRNMSMPSVNIPSMSLPSPISVGWSGSPRFFSGVWGGGGAPAATTESLNEAKDNPPSSTHGTGMSGSKLRPGYRSARSIDSMRSGSIPRFFELMRADGTDEDEEEDDQEEEEEEEEEGSDEEDVVDDEEGVEDEEEEGEREMPRSDRIERIGHR